LKFINYLLITIFCISALEAKYDLSIAAMFQNEAPYLKEWIEFHKLVGVQHFYLFNNLSKDNYKEILKPYILSGEVELFQVPTETHDGDQLYALQRRVYSKAIKKAKGKTRWLAILDLDEFLFAVNEDNVADFLNANFKEYSGVRVNWQIFGTSNVEAIPQNKLMIEMLTMKARPNYSKNYSCKSIVRPECVLHANIHICCYKPGCMEVNGAKKMMRDNNTGCHIDEIRINHYITRDESYYDSVKVPRLLKRNDNNTRAKLFRIKNTLSQYEDSTILRFVPALRARMGY